MKSCERYPDLAGEFVVSVAGPNVESLIAGKGAGAAQYSQKNYATVTNVDIGGGSANSATFRTGNLIGAAAMNYGGRILEVENSTGRVRHIAEPARHILNDIGLNLQVGDSPSLDDLRRFHGPHGRYDRGTDRRHIVAAGAKNLSHAADRCFGQRLGADVFGWDWTLLLQPNSDQFGQ